VASQSDADEVPRSSVRQLAKLATSPEVSATVSTLSACRSPRTAAATHHATSKDGVGWGGLLQLRGGAG
jgi:hypothetical protein